MIYIIGDTAGELADLQKLLETGLSKRLETGLLNSNDTVLDVTYKLSSGDALLVDKHNHIIGIKEQMKKALDILAEKSGSGDDDWKRHLLQMPKRTDSK